MKSIFPLIIGLGLLNIFYPETSTTAIQHGVEMSSVYKKSGTAPFQEKIIPEWSTFFSTVK